MISRDEELAREIRSILQEDSRVDVNEVDVSVRGGVVRLEGAVDSAAERKAVRDDVETIPGVDEVEDHLKLRNYIERSDEELREAVKQDLMRDPYVDSSHIKVQAHNGEIVLSGNVSTFAEKNAAENVTWWSPGVTNVVSRLQTEEVDLMEEEPSW